MNLISNEFTFFVLSLLGYFLILPAFVQSVNLTIIHNNDFHSRYLPFKWSTYTECDPHSAKFKSDVCVGGLARTVHMMKVFRKTIPNLLFLNAGDHFQGTFWYTMLKSHVVAEMVSLMKHDTMALGNHEFDDGSEELKKFIDQIKQTDAKNMSIISCNVNVDKDPILEGLIEKSTIRIIDQSNSKTKVAIIGYTTPDTVFLSKPSKSVQFIDEIVAIKSEIKRLKEKHPDLNIFIAVGHSGYEKDLELAKAIPDLDVVVGGHSNTFLYTSKKLPSNEIPEGEYPMVINHNETKQKTLVLEAFAYGKYLGKLDLVFDKIGQIVSYAGQPIYLDASIQQDENARKTVLKLYEQLNVKFNETLGFAVTDLQAEPCRLEECPIANLVTDSLTYNFDRLVGKNLGSLTKCNNTLAIINGGNIRSGIDQGNITYKEVLSVLPFGNSNGLVQVKGKQLIEIFQHSARQFGKGGFLQISRIRVTYKLNNKQATLIKLQTNCRGQWKNVQYNENYVVAVTDFLVHGGDNYTINPQNWVDYQQIDSDLFLFYIKKIQKLRGRVEGRILFESSSSSALYLSMNVWIFYSAISLTIFQKFFKLSFY